MFLITRVLYKRIVHSSLYTRSNLDHNRRDAGKHPIESGQTVLNQQSTESGSGGFEIFNTLGLTGVQKNTDLSQGITVALLS